jgi:hypothetical protein
VTKRNELTSRDKEVTFMRNPNLNRQTLRKRKAEFSKGLYTTADGFKLLGMAVILIAILVACANYLM